MGTVAKITSMTLNISDQSNNDLVSRNIRGAVSALAEYLDQKDILRAWLRAEFKLPKDLRDITLRNAWSYDRSVIHDTMSASVNWADPAESTDGLRALSTITILAGRSGQILNTDDVSLFMDFEEVRRACSEDGLKLDENGNISQADVVTLEDLDVSGIGTIDGVLREVKKLNQAITRDQDLSDVIGHSKSLIEAVSAAIMDAHGIPAQESRSKKVMERVSEVHRLLGIKSDDLSAGGAAVALNDIAKGLNRLVQSVQYLRNHSSDAGHANHTVPQIDPESAQLSVDCALAWCRYVLSLQARRASEAPF